MVAIIGADFRRFRPLVDLHREAGRRAGYPPETLRVGVHAFGFVAQNLQRAADEISPGYARLRSTLGRERGWAPPTRAQFDASCTPAGPFLIGDVQSVADKVLYRDRVLGGVSRDSFQMTNVLLPHASMLRASGLLDTQVIPQVRERRSVAAAPGS